jgi:hypothetical protein
MRYFFSLSIVGKAASEYTGEPDLQLELGILRGYIHS